MKKVTKKKRRITQDQLRAAFRKAAASKHGIHIRF